MKRQKIIEKLKNEECEKIEEFKKEFTTMCLNLFKKHGLMISSWNEQTHICLYNENEDEYIIDEITDSSFHRKGHEFRRISENDYTYTHYDFI